MTQVIIEVKRFRDTNRCCMCCRRNMRQYPRLRMYSMKVGCVIDEKTGSQMTNETILCEDCRELLGTKLWYYDQEIAESHIYKKIDNLTDIPNCCGDCKETKCKLPYDAYGIEVIDPYMFDERHKKCPLRRI